MLQPGTNLLAHVRRTLGVTRRAGDPTAQARNPPAGTPRIIDPPDYCTLDPPCGWCLRTDGVLVWDCWCPNTPGPSLPHELGVAAAQARWPSDVETGLKLAKFDTMEPRAAGQPPLTPNL